MIQPAQTLYFLKIKIIFMVCETGIFLLRLISLSKTEKQEKVRILKFSTHLWQLNKSVTKNMMISPF